MNLPKVLSATAFDRHNLHLCTVTFETVPEEEQQDRLQSIALQFNPTSEHGRSASRFYIEFRGNTATFCQRTDGGSRVPTEDEFQQLLQQLGIDLPSKPAAGKPIAKLSRQIHLTHAAA